MRKATLARIFGISILLASWLVLFVLFAKAYLHDSKSATIYINDYGEANVEMILFIVSIPPAFIVFNEYIYLLVRREASES